MSKYSNTEVFDLVYQELVSYGLNEKFLYFESSQDLIMMVMENPELRKKTLHQMAAKLSEEFEIDLRRVFERLRAAACKVSWGDKRIENLIGLKDFEKRVFPTCGRYGPEKIIKAAPGEQDRETA